MSISEDDSTTIRAVLDGIVDGVVDDEEISQLMDDLLRRVEENVRVLSVLSIL